MRISHSLIPPGGWKFQEGTLVLTAQTWNDLVTKVTQHRLSNNVPVGNIEEEIEDQIAEANPSIIINGPKSKKNQWA